MNVRKKWLVLALAAVMGSTLLSGCGSEKKTASEPVETPEIVSEYAENAAPAADAVENAAETAKKEISEQGLVSQEELLSMVQMVVAGSLDPCSDAATTMRMSQAGAYLQEAGAQKAPDHALTKLGEAVLEYTRLISVEGRSYNDPEAMAALDDIDAVVDSELADDEAIQAQAAEFYQLIQ